MQGKGDDEDHQIQKQADQSESPESEQAFESSEALDPVDYEMGQAFQEPS